VRRVAARRHSPRTEAKPAHNARPSVPALNEQVRKSGLVMLAEMREDLRNNYFDSTFRGPLSRPVVLVLPGAVNPEPGVQQWNQLPRARTGTDRPWRARRRLPA